MARGLTGYSAARGAEVRYRDAATRHVVNSNNLRRAAARRDLAVSRSNVQALARQRAKLGTSPESRARAQAEITRARGEANVLRQRAVRAATPAEANEHLVNARAAAARARGHQAELEKLGNLEKRAQNMAGRALRPRANAAAAKLDRAGAAFKLNRARWYDAQSFRARQVSEKLMARATRLPVSGEKLTVKDLKGLNKPAGLKKVGGRLLSQDVIGEGFVRKLNRLSPGKVSTNIKLLPERTGSPRVGGVDPRINPKTGLPIELNAEMKYDGSLKSAAAEGGRRVLGKLGWVGVGLSAYDAYRDVQNGMPVGQAALKEGGTLAVSTAAGTATQSGVGSVIKYIGRAGTKTVPAADTGALAPVAEESAGQGAAGAGTAGEGIATAGAASSEAASGAAAAGEAGAAASGGGAAAAETAAAAAGTAEAAGGGAAVAEAAAGAAAGAEVAGGVALSATGVGAAVVAGAAVGTWVASDWESSGASHDFENGHPIDAVKKTGAAMGDDVADAGSSVARSAKDAWEWVQSQ